MTYKKILVPYDTSNPAENALKHAVKLAKTYPETEIILLNVLTEIPIYPAVEHALKSRKTSKLTAIKEHKQYVYSALKEEVAKVLEEKKREYAQAEGLKSIRTEALLGRPIDKILEYAESNGVELIIMGSTGHGKFAKKILGSVSQGVLERARIPVMIVR